jgi:hypothetical protein
MIRSIRHLRPRDFRFLGLVTLTALTVSLYLDASLRLAGQAGSGWRVLDLDALGKRIESGELRDQEADWYHPSTEEEARGLGETP